MSSPDVLTTCATAFLAIFALLSLLAILMRILMALFPELLAETDAAVLAAITTTYARLCPGFKISEIEEEE